MDQFPASLNGSLEERQNRCVETQARRSQGTIEHQYRLNTKVRILYFLPYVKEVRVGSHPELFDILI